MPNNSSLEKRLFWTLAGLAAYQLLWLVPVPNLGNSALTTMWGGVLGGFGTVSIATLGLNPFLAGFLVVELFSLVTPWGRKVRRKGFEGRSALTRWSLQVSLVVAIVQAMAIVAALNASLTAEYRPLFASQGLMPRLLVASSLVATSFAVYALGRVMTQKGLGNGFCLLILVDPVLDIVGAWIGSPRATYGAIPWDFVHGVAAVIALVGLVHYLRNSLAPANLSGASEGEDASSWVLPSFPQGLIPAAWALGLVQLLQFGWGYWGDPDGVPLPEGSVISLVLLVLLIPSSSWVTLLMFSTRGRLVTNLPEVTIPRGFDSALERRLLISTALLLTLMVAFGALGSFTYWSPVLDALLLIGLAAFGVDLFEEWRFRRRHEAVVELVELDNVQLAHYLRGALQSRGIDHWTQAFHYRSLTYFFGPLFKMTVLVPTGRLDEARELWDELDPKVV